MNVRLNPRELPNGTILVFGVSYKGRTADPDATRGRTPPKIFTYALIKAGSLWHMTGVGQTPQAAGWLAVERWLGKEGRKLEWVEVVTARMRLGPDMMPMEVEAAPPASNIWTADQILPG